MELARAGLFVYATGRSSRVSGRSEIDRPETIEETGDRIRAAGGKGSALVVDHENPASVTGLLATVEREHGRLDVLVNDIFGGDRYAEWEKPRELTGSVERPRRHRPCRASTEEITRDR